MKSKEQLNREIENIIASELRSLLLQSNDENSDKKPMHPVESNRLINFPNQTSDASANLEEHPHIALRSDQNGGTMLVRLTILFLVVLRLLF